MMTAEFDVPKTWVTLRTEEEFDAYRAKWKHVRHEGLEKEDLPVLVINSEFIPDMNGWDKVWHFGLELNEAADYLNLVTYQVGSFLGVEEADEDGWIEGSPALGPGCKERALWLKLHDQGGHSFVVMGYLYGTHDENFQRDQKEWTQWMLGGRKGPRPPGPKIIPTLNVPSLKHDAPLESWWNIDGYREVEKPKP